MLLPWRAEKSARQVISKEIAHLDDEIAHCAGEPCDDSWHWFGGRPPPRALRRARTLRSSIYRLLMSCAAGGRLAVTDLKALNAMVSASVRRQEPREAGSKVVWRWRVDASSCADFILWQVAQSAAALLSGDVASRLRLCASEDCGWVFVDESRNGMRRWCSMEGCGNSCQVGGTILFEVSSRRQRWSGAYR